MQIKVFTSNSVFASAENPVPAQALLDFFTTPEARGVFEAKGFEL